MRYARWCGRQLARRSVQAIVVMALLSAGALALWADGEGTVWSGRRFLLKGSSGEAVACFHADGSLSIKGTCTEYNSPVEPDSSKAEWLLRAPGWYLAALVLEDDGSPSSVGDLRLLDSVVYVEQITYPLTADSRPYVFVFANESGERVAAISDWGNLYLTGSLYQNVENPKAPPGVTFLAPSNLAAWGVVASIQLDWEPASPSEGMTGYHVYRAATNDFASATCVTAGAPVTATQYIDDLDGLADPTATYYYWVTAVFDDYDVETDESNSASASAEGTCRQPWPAGWM